MFNFILIIFISFCFSQGYNMQLVSHLPYEIDASDITGFSQDGREFAVIGLQNAASFVDISDPYNPYEISRIDGSNSIWRDLKYWNRHVYIGTEADDGIKVVSVDNPDNPILVYTITDVDNSHNIHVDNDGYLYIVGADQHDIWIYNLENPAYPNLIGTWDFQNGSNSTDGYCHDIEVYNNKLYCASIYVGYFRIIDVSDKTNPTTLISHFTGNSGISTHDVAVTEDENYLFTGDENLGGHIKVWDISDYNNINLVDEYITPEGEEHTAHNLYVRPGTDQLIISYYADGTRIVDISDPENVEEIAYFDFSDTEGLYVSNWGVYAYLPSGYFISSDIEQGLFITELGGISIVHEELTDIDIDEEGPYIPFSATVESFNGPVEEVTLHYSLDNVNWETFNMFYATENTYDFIYTPDQEGIVIYYYITASNSQGQTSYYPPGNEPIMFVYGNLEDIVIENFEIDPGWTVESDASSGLWEIADPMGTTTQNGTQVQPEDDYTVNGNLCYITGNGDGSGGEGQADIDGGSTTIITEEYNLSNFDDVLLTYYRWYSNDLGNNPGTDRWVVQISNNSGDSWIDLENTTNSNNSWLKKRYVLTDYIELTSNVVLRFTASDLSYDGDVGSGGSLVEAGLDDFMLEAIAFDSLLGDINLDNSVDVLDVVITVSIILGESTPFDDQLIAADLNNDGVVTVLDIVLLVDIVLGD